MAFTYTPDGKLALFVGDVGAYGALSSPTKVGGVPISAAIETSSTTRGNVLPRMTSAQIAAIAVPVAGMYAFNTDLQAIVVYTTSGWITQSTPAGEQYSSGVLTAAQLNGMFAAPVTLIAAPGANKSIIVKSLLLELVSDGTAFANGGVIGARYSSGAAVTGTASATFLTGAAVNRLTLLNGVFSNSVVADYSNTAVQISSAIAAFTLGGASIVNWKIWYSVVPTA